jgi:hypothetical protein
MDKHENTVKILKSFLSTYTIDGVCEFIVDPEMDVNDSYWVYMVIDLDWLEQNPVIPDFNIKRMRQYVKEMIMKYTGRDVHVGSFSQKCSELLSESMPTQIRRRLDFNLIKLELDNIIDYELNVCDYSPVGEFIGEVCNMVNERIIYDITTSTNIKVSPKETDELYFYMVDTFGDYLAKKYKIRCADGISESKKTYIIKESQLKLLHESQISTYQKLLDYALSNLKSDCENESSDYDSCEEIDLVDNIKIINVDSEISKGSKSFEPGTQLLIFKVDINSSLINYFLPFTLTFELSQRVSNFVGLPVRIDIENVNHKQTP